MAITLYNADTGQTWVLPNAASASTLYMGNPPYPPGDYKITNGSASTLTVTSIITGTIPAGAMKSFSTKQNLYSWIPVGVDYAVWNSHMRGNNGRAG